MRRFWNRKGQNTLEYAFLIVVVVAGLLAVQRYLGRGMQGRGKQSFDSIGEQSSPGHMRSFYDITVNHQYGRELFGRDAQGNLVKGYSQSITGGGRTDKVGNEEILQALDEEEIWDQ